jgi:hypothetical protein
LNSVPSRSAMFRPQCAAPSVCVRSVGIDDGSVITDDRKLLDHPDTDRWIDAPMPRPNRLVLIMQTRARHQCVNMVC